MLYRTHRFFAASLLVAALSLPASAQQQDTLRLTLQNVVERAQTESPMAEIARLGYESDQLAYRAFRTEYMPALSFTGSAPGLDRSIDAVQQPDGTTRYVSRETMSSELDLRITQPVPWTGGEVFMSSNLARADVLGSGNDAGYEYQASPFVIGFTQPIFQFNEMKWERRIQPLQYRLAQRNYAEELAQSAVDGTSLFFDVHIAKMNVDLAAFNVQVNETIYQQAGGRFGLGQIAENDLLQSELQLLNAQTSLSDAQIVYDRALQDLKTALGLPYNQPIAVSPPQEILQIAIDPNQAVQLARENQSAFLQMDIQEVQAEQSVAQARYLNSFSADITARYGLNQTGSDLGYIYGDPLNSQRFGISFDIPVFDWGRSRAEYQSAVVEQEETQRSIALQREQLEQDVYFEALQFRQLQQQVAIAAKADTIATRRFEVARNRFSVGQIDITDLFDAQAAKDQSSQAYIRTISEFWVSYYRLREITLFDFVLNQPLMGPAQ